MEQQHNDSSTKIVTADPSALGLFGLAMVTLVASSQKLGFTSGLSFVIPWALFLGALAQLFACAGDSKRNNTFGTTAFGAFGFFWLAVAMSWLVKMGVFGEQLASTVDMRQLGIAFAGYLIFSVYMTIGSMGTNKVLFIIFILIDFLFIGLSGSSLGIFPEISHKIAAFSELFISLMSFYGSAASVLNSQFGKILLPVGKPILLINRAVKPQKATVHADTHSIQIVDQIDNSQIQLTT